ncbi:hypothetical protein HMPREF0083_05088 [Aneurinibacillus aneurinilyticus ATCC 12856]|uniref:Uncharacterized protein n=1 Tax=Aneurinibacillus aneurinilyticus ATCC 12856 TaxID=649747 RepID=U1Y7N6_ANEAE|nr:hypothetical protein HMPREF0083_05088 [Aneurinibacillus aneurinilyticus ATCC 12856]
MRLGKKKRVDAPTAPPAFLTSHHKNVSIYQIRCIYIFQSIL